LAHPEGSLRRWRIDYSKRCIDMAQTLGAANVSVTSGRPLPGVSVEQSMDHLRASLRELTDWAGQCGIRIGIEYEPGLLVECCEELAVLLDELNSPVLGANLDLGHSHVLGEDPARVFAQLADRVFHLHLEDIRHRKHYHLIPGEGDIDFKHLFKLLRDGGYDGFATVELYTYPHRPDHAALQSYRHLQGIIASLHGNDSIVGGFGPADPIGRSRQP
jgi:sugar phosphate isomerase/epimerase